MDLVGNPFFVSSKTMALLRVDSVQTVRVDVTGQGYVTCNNAPDVHRVEMVDFPEEKRKQYHDWPVRFADLPPNTIFHYDPKTLKRDKTTEWIGAPVGEYKRGRKRTDRLSPPKEEPKKKRQKAEKAVKPSKKAEAKAKSSTSKSKKKHAKVLGKNAEPTPAPKVL